MSNFIFTYDHLYHIVIQSWMDLPTIFSNDFRKQLIMISCNGSLPTDIIEQFKLNAHEWFVNLSKKSIISDLINWICNINYSGELHGIKSIYEKKHGTFF